MRGGARNNPGRKQTVPPGLLRDRAGLICDELWQKAADKILEQKIKKKYGKRLKRVGEHQARLQSIKPEQRHTKTARDTRKDVKDDLNVVLKTKSRVLLVSRLQKRPWGVKAAVLAQAIPVFAKYTRRKTGKPIILTSYRMRRYWDEWKRKKKHLQLKTH